MNNLNEYKCLANQIYDFNNYSLVPIREEDIQDIRRWRNDQSDVLRQEKLLTYDDQIKYYNYVIKKSFSEEKPSMILFSFLFENKCIGYGGLTNIDWISKNAEISFIVDTNRTHNNEIYEKDFSTFLHLIKNLAFVILNLQKLFTETYDIRPKHVAILEKFGFELESIVKNHKTINGKKISVLFHSLKRLN